MSWADDDLRRPIETYMWAFGWYLSPDNSAKLAAQAPALHAWVRTSLERLSGMSDLELFRARLDQPLPKKYERIPLFQRHALKQALAEEMRGKIERGSVPSVSSLAQYCLLPRDPFAVE